MTTTKYAKQPETEAMSLEVNEEPTLLSKIKEADLTKVAIFSGAGVDPDGLASQATMAAILELWGHESHSFFRGTFNRPQNRTFKQVLGLSPKNEDEFDPGAGWTCIISVDGPAHVCPVQPHFIIDHHEQGKPGLLGTDVRIIGSCSAILWQYAMEAGVDFTSEAGAKLATALAVGILTDTKTGSVEKASELDFEALAFCLKHKGNKLYKDILNFPKPSYYNDLLVKGWKNKTQEGTVLVASLGKIPASRGGVISDVAEQFAETDTVSTAIVFAIVENPEGNAIDISVRSSNSTLDVDEFVKKAFSNDGGGKTGSGRAVIPLPPIFSDIEEASSDKLSDTVNMIVTHKALQFAGDKK